MQDDFDIIKILRNQSSRDVVECRITQKIYRRLLDWGCSAAHSNNRSARLDTREVAITWEIFNRFCQGYGKGKFINEIDGTQGWKCGLGQILDIRQKEILEVLPYILTAYMYNFCEEYGTGSVKWEHTRFVKHFYQQQMDSRNPSGKNTEEILFGLNIL